MSDQADKGSLDIYQKFINRIKDRLNKHNQNCLIAICGGTGSGKTYAALSLAEDLSSNPINIENNVAFTSKEFMQKLNNPDLQPGDYIIFDEAGVGMSSKEWFSIQNKLLNYVLQTFRHRNIGVIFTMPGLKLLDNSARMLLHYYMETIQIHRRDNLNQIKVLEFNYSSIQDKIYRKFPVFYDENSNPCTMKYLFVKKPSLKLVRDYEKKKNEYTANLNKSIIRELDNLSKPDPKENTMSCPDCSGKFWRYISSKEQYLCRRCGRLQTLNPFTGRER